MSKVEGWGMAGCREGLSEGRGSRKESADPGRSEEVVEESEDILF